MRGPRPAGEAEVGSNVLWERPARSVFSLLAHPWKSTWNQWLAVVNGGFWPDRDLRDLAHRVLMAGWNGRLRKAQAGSAAAFPFERSGPDDSIIDEGEPPAAVPGLVPILVDLTWRQYAELVDQKSKDDKLGEYGLVSINIDERPFPYRFLRRGVFLDELGVGQTGVVTGVPGSGKTHFAVNDLIGPWVEADKNNFVVTNIVVHLKDERIVCVQTFSQFVEAIAKIRKAGGEVLIVRDEGGLGRERSKAVSNRNINQKRLTLVARKFHAREIVIYQRPEDVPSELWEFATHLFHKPSKRHRDRVVIDTPALGRLVVGEIPGEDGRKELGFPIYRYEDNAPVLKPDLDLLWILEQILGSTFQEQLDGILAHIAAMKGKANAAPLSTAQWRQLLIGIHLDSTKMGYRKFWAFFQDLFVASDYSSENQVYKLTVDIGIKSHTDSYEKWCDWCLANRSPPERIARPAAAAASDS